MTSLQNNCSKQQQTLSGKLASVFEKDFTIDVLLNKKLQKAKIKASKGKKTSNADADADAEMPMLRFPNGLFIVLSVVKNYLRPKSAPLRKYHWMRI